MALGTAIHCARAVPRAVPRAAFWHSCGMLSHRCGVWRCWSYPHHSSVTAPRPPQESCVYKAEFSMSLHIRGYIQVAVVCEGKDSLVGTWELKAEKDVNRASTLRFLLTTLKCTKLTSEQPGRGLS